MISVQRSLRKVPGVSKAHVSLEKAEAVIAYDDAKTNVEALIKATTAAGFPSTVKAQ